MTKYKLYIDDTGFNKKDKSSKTLQSENCTYVGVLIPDDINYFIRETLASASAVLIKKYNVSEFHFTEIYNRKEPFKNIEVSETLDILNIFSRLIQELDLKIVVSTQTDKQNDSNLENLLMFTEKQLNLPYNQKSHALLLTYARAKKYLNKKNKKAQITDVVCDEGLRKHLAFEKLDHNTALTFKSSRVDSLLQVADFSAWITTRAKHIFDKISKNKKIGEVDREILYIYSSLSDNFVNLSKKKINLDSLETFDYDQIIEDSTNDKK